MALFAPSWSNQAHAGQLDCGAMADSLNTGDHYTFKLEIQSKMMRLEKGDDFCTEDVKAWFKRQLILPAPARENIPLPKLPPSQAQKDNAPVPGSPDNTPLPGQQIRQGPMPDMGLGSDSGAAPLPIQREFVKPKQVDEEGALSDEEAAAQALQEGQQGDPQASAKAHVSSDPNVPGSSDPNVPGSSDLNAPASGVVPGAELETPTFGVEASPPPVRDESMVKRCDRDLTAFWSPGEHKIEGHKFWLSGVFTIDLDSDGRVDDVGFKIKSEGKIGNILNYFPSTEGRAAGQNIDSLKLDDDRDIHRLCPGNITFEREESTTVEKKELPAPNQVRALVKEADKKVEAETPEEIPEEPEKPKKKTSVITLVVGGIAMLLLLAGGIGLIFAMRNFTRSKKKDDDDDDDDEDEDDDED